MQASENPFSVQRIHALRFWFAGSGSVEALAAKFWDRVAQGERRQVLLGGHGSGKSTLLREIGRFWEVEGRPVIRIDGAKLLVNSEPAKRANRLERRLGQVLLIDSAEKLPWIEWLRIWWKFRNTPILATAHRPGRFAVLYHCRPSVADLERFCEELVGGDGGWFREQCPREQLAQIFTAWNGDIRQCFFELYDRVAQGTGPLGQKSRIICEPSPLIVPEKQA
ncbi:MAG: hypothetical protein JNL67_06830 [Planctomycetaceae bacterium]|nr:hypothetical protein [Planctomycetaceae bacterium]